MKDEDSENAGAVKPEGFSSFIIHTSAQRLLPALAAGRLLDVQVGETFLDRFLFAGTLGFA